MRLFHFRSPLLPTVAACALAVLVWAAVPASTTQTDLASDLPPGALMTLESPDFAALLGSWTHSPEGNAWLNSASYSAFGNSRLFSRLSDAQGGFASAAKTDVDGTFLQQIAGKESIFAWYDIGNLQFLYITHLPHEQIARIALLQQRSSFARRESAGTAFYVRTTTGAAASADSADDAGPASANAGDAADDTPSPDLDQPRTVAFAIRGDWLLLATREDLIANALQLMAPKAASSGSSDSQADAGWFAAASAAGPTQRGDLHMVLDLQSLTKTPQFRTYWIQRNVTDTSRYRAAVVDLYREPGRFREERVLLPLDTTAHEDEVDLGPLEALVPEHVAIYQARAQPTTDAVASTIEEKLLGSPASVTRDANGAPLAITLPVSGSAQDPETHSSDSQVSAGKAFDTRIDAPEPVLESASQAIAPLRRELEAAQVGSMLTLQRSDPPTPDVPFIRIRSAVVLRSSTAWNPQTLSEAVSAALGSRLTTGGLGLQWQQVPSPGGGYLRLAGPQSLTLFIDGQMAILSNDGKLLADILALRQHAAPPQPARLVAGIRPGEERGNFRRLTAQLAYTAAPPEATSPDTSVQLFRDNLPGLADAFSGLDSERIIERRQGGTVHQTVTYRWAGAPQNRP